MDVIEVDADTCDECGPTVKAYLYAEHDNWPASLAFCAHCGTKHLDRLIATGAHVIDLRYLVEP